MGAAQLIAELEDAAVSTGRNPAVIRLSALASENQVDSFIPLGGRADEHDRLTLEGRPR